MDLLILQLSEKVGGQDLTIYTELEFFTFVFKTVALPAIPSSSYAKVSSLQKGISLQVLCKWTGSIQVTHDTVNSDSTTEIGYQGQNLA